MNITLPKQPFIAQQDGENRATVVIENLYPGYGVTLGNALRRVLLSSLPGAAVIAAKIEGVEHEFSALPHIQEDVIGILLNLKKQRFRLHSTEPVKAHILTKGEKQITGNDIKGPSELEVVSKDVPIATLTDSKAQLEMELLIQQGLGYKTAEEHKRDHDFEIGMIAVDSIFSPVLAANYRVEDMRVGERTDYNRLILFIETDGTLKPEQALRNSIEILLSQYQALKKIKLKAKTSAESFKKTGLSDKKARRKKKVSRKDKDKEAQLRKTKLEDLKLSSRTESALQDAGVRTVGGLLQKGEKNLREMKGVGDKAIKEIRRKIGRLGLVLEE